MRYPIVIEVGSDSSACGVVVPDVPGCFSAGDTLDEAVSNATEALMLWIEDAIERGCSVPQPSTLSDLKAAKDYEGREWIWRTVSVDNAVGYAD